MSEIILADVITIGDEILYGQIVDTNTQWISEKLDMYGFKVRRKMSVGDQAAEIEDIVTESSKKAHIIILTGGLGPTKDDITKTTLARLFNDTLVIEPHAEALIRDYFISRGRPFTELNRQQAAIPSKCTYLPNLTGTAPGMWFENNGTILVSLPGVPYEMKYLMEKEVLPRLKTHFNAPTIYHRVVRTIGIGESFLAEKIEAWEDNLPKEIKLAYLPGNGQVKLRLTGIGDDLSHLQQLVQMEVEKLEKQIPEYIYSTKNQEMPEVIGELLVEQQKTIAVAESCTGGYLAHLISEVPGCSRYFMGSVTSYDNSIKIGELGVSPQTLEQFGAVSEQTAAEMAEGIRQKMKVDFALATTGVAGPSGGSEEKPVGTVWIACAGPKETVTQKLQLTTQRGTNIRWASYLTLNLLRKELIKNQ